MIFEPQKFTYILQDALYSMAAGFTAGFFYRWLDVFLPKGKVRVFIKDIVTAVFFSFVMYSYVVSFANYRVLRWYNVLFGIIGMILFDPVFNTGLKILFSVVKLLLFTRLKRIVDVLMAERNKFISKQKEKYQKITPKNSPQLLKQDDKILYN